MSNFCHPVSSHSYIHLFVFNSKKGRNGEGMSAEGDDRVPSLTLSFISVFQNGDLKHASACLNEIHIWD